MLNLGSSARVAPGWNNVDFSWLVRLGRHPRLCELLHRLQLLNDQRFARIRAMDPDTVLWNLSNGIPFADSTFHVCYHSHVLEHLDRGEAPAFVRECFRVLRSGGVLRVVVPDLEQLAREYLRIVDALPDESAAGHDRAICEIFDQMVPRIPRHRAGEPWLVRVVENAIIGDTARAGILHRWMYDRHSLERLLRDAGFVDVAVRSHDESGVPGWGAFGLDVEPNGSPYKPGSLYIEGRRA